MKGFKGGIGKHTKGGMMRYLVMLTIVIPVFAGQEVLCPATLTIPHFTGVPNQGPSTAALETLFYDDGTPYSAWCWVAAGRGWGYFFDAGQGCDIIAIGAHFHSSWPGGGSTYDVYVFDGTSSGPTTELHHGQNIPGTMGQWNWYDLPSAIPDADGQFFGFYFQNSANPNCFGLSEDMSQENPSVDWWTSGSSHGQGFPRYDFLVRAVVDKPGIEEESSYNIWSVKFPTITDGSFNLRFNLKKPANITLSTYDLTGKMVDRTKSTVESKMSVDLSRLPNGVYFLRAENGTEVETGRILIIH